MSSPPASPEIPVLHLVNGEHYAGAERVQDLLALRLPEFGFRAGLACVKPGRFPEARAAKAAPLYNLPMRSRFDLRPVGKLVRRIRSEGYRILHTHTPRTALVGRLVAALAGVPMVHHVHSPASRDSTRRWADCLNARVERWALRGAARLIAVSESLGRHMAEQGFGPPRLAVVHNGVPAPAVSIPREPPRGAWTLGMAALFRPRKGVETLLDALGRLRQWGLPVRLRAVGPFETPQYEAEVKGRTSAAGLAECVDWTGFASDIHAELARIDLFVLPSLFGEGLPMVVLEAMAAGVPVVATEVEGVPEAVRDGLDGVVVRPGDPEALASAVARVVRGELDWSKLRASALARHAAHFSDRGMAAAVAAVYRDLLETCR